VTPPDATACTTTCTRDITYRLGKGADPARNRLDVYAPRGKKDCPVVVVVHGGAWVLGDNRCCGLYTSVGEFLASQGIVAVLPNYRLSPAVKHPEHAKDIACAVAWTKAHAGEYGGNPERLFLMGHSAGGHLVALLATDGRYLKAEGMDTADIRGVIGVSGVYEIPPGNTDVEIGGSKPLGVRLDEMAPIRHASKPRDPQAPAKAGLPVSINVFGPSFGDDATVRADASPIRHVQTEVPPFLLIVSDNDLPLLPKMASDMHQKLLWRGNRSTLVTIERRNHNSVFFKAIEPHDPAASAILDFIRRQDSVAATESR
jgi:acetyl esterase/lipase